ncbi:hypothetical protein ERJ75_001719900 [Trypanosoma vivax]|nr:hypothetical protein ERJ75_001719900 [Trypanosoma vivax]
MDARASPVAQHRAPPLRSFLPGAAPTGGVKLHHQFVPSSLPLRPPVRARRAQVGVVVVFAASALVCRAALRRGATAVPDECSLFSCIILGSSWRARSRAVAAERHRVRGAAIVACMPPSQLLSRRVAGPQARAACTCVPVPEQRRTRDSAGVAARVARAVFVLAVGTLEATRNVRLSQRRREWTARPRTATGPCGRHARARAGRCAAGGLSRPDRASWSGLLRPRPAHAGLGPGAGAPPSRAAGAHRRRRTDAGDANARAPCRAGRPRARSGGRVRTWSSVVSCALGRRANSALAADSQEADRRAWDHQGQRGRGERRHGRSARGHRGVRATKAGRVAGRGSRRPPPDCETAGDTSKEVVGDARRHGRQSLRHVCVRAANRSNRTRADARAHSRQNEPQPERTTRDRHKARTLLRGWMGPKRATVTKRQKTEQGQ